MKFRPILFSGEMVQAILAGRKTQTRRLVLPQPKWDPISCHHISKFGCWNYGRPFISPPDFARDDWPFHPGDILWVRETWAEMPYGYVYRADDEKPDGWDAVDRWKPSIHMPKVAARTFLRVVSVRLEELTGISDADCAAEGIREWFVDDGFCARYAPQGGNGPAWPLSECPATPVEAMKKLWDSTIKPDKIGSYCWLVNPWVWVVEFERCDKPEGWCS